MRKIRQALPLLSCTLTLCCCMTHQVQVVDQRGNPVADASVEPISLSMNHPKQVTGHDGKAELPHGIQKIEWVSVIKKGFKPSGRVAVDGKNPQMIVLSPAQ